MRRQLRPGGLVLSQDAKIVFLSSKNGNRHGRLRCVDAILSVCGVDLSQGVTPKDVVSGWLGAVTSAIKA